jgi:hypothetical protein
MGCSNDGSTASSYPHLIQHTCQVGCNAHCYVAISLSTQIMRAGHAKPAIPNVVECAGLAKTAYIYMRNERLFCMGGTGIAKSIHDCLESIPSWATHTFVDFTV